MPRERGNIKLRAWHARRKSRVTRPPRPKRQQASASPALGSWLTLSLLLYSIFIVVFTVAAKGVARRVPAMMMMMSVMNEPSRAKDSVLGSSRCRRLDSQNKHKTKPNGARGGSRPTHIHISTPPWNKLNASLNLWNIVSSDLLRSPPGGALPPLFGAKVLNSIFEMNFWLCAFPYFRGLNCRQGCHAASKLKSSGSAILLVKRQPRRMEDSCRKRRKAGVMEATLSAAAERIWRGKTIRECRGALKESTWKAPYNPDKKLKMKATFPKTFVNNCNVPSLILSLTMYVKLCKGNFWKRWDWFQPKYVGKN